MRDRRVLRAGAAYGRLACKEFAPKKVKARRREGCPGFRKMNHGNQLFDRFSLPVLCCIFNQVKSVINGLKYSIFYLMTADIYSLA